MLTGRIAMMRSVGCRGIGAIVHLPLSRVQGSSEPWLRQVYEYKAGGILSANGKYASISEGMNLVS